MSKYQFMGPAHFRKISSKDFAGVGLDHGDVHVARHDVSYLENPKGVPTSIELSDEAAAHLAQESPKAWKKLKEDAPAQSESNSPELPLDGSDASDASGSVDKQAGRITR